MLTYGSIKSLVSVSVSLSLSFGFCSHPHCFTGTGGTGGRGGGLEIIDYSFPIFFRKFDRWVLGDLTYFRFSILWPDFPSSSSSSCSSCVDGRGRSQISLSSEVFARRNGRKTRRRRRRRDETLKQTSITNWKGKETNKMSPVLAAGTKSDEVLFNHNVLIYYFFSLSLFLSFSFSVNFSLCFVFSGFFYFS